MKRRIVSIALLCLMGIGGFGADFTRTLSLKAPRQNGEDVLEVQNALLTLGFQGIGIPDGWYGPRTEAAVKSLQRYLGFSQDGAVDQELWRSLFAPEGVLRGLLADLKAANSLAFERLTRTEKDLPGRSAEGGSMTAFMDRQEKKYVELAFFGELGKVEYSIYLFEDRRVILKKTFKYPSPFDLERSTIEEAAYYLTGKILYRVRKGSPTEAGEEGAEIRDLPAL